MSRKTGIHFFTVVILFTVYLVNGLLAVPCNSVTHDEMNHWSYGKRILKLQPQKVYLFDDGSAMPVTGLNALPRAVEQVLDPQLLKTDGGFSDIMHGRYVTLFICLLTGFFIYRWSKELFGETAALFSFFLFVFCPNLNAHTGLLTSDAYAALLTVSTAYFFYRFNSMPSWVRFLAFSLSLGIAQVTKYTLFHLFPVFLILSLVLIIQKKTYFSHWKKNLLRATVLFAVVLAVINVAYLFNGTGDSLSEINLHSQAFSQLQQTFIGKIPLPLPVPYVEGMDITTYMNELGAGDPNVSGQNYLLGVKKAGEGFPWYYLVVFVFKTPISVLILFIISLILLITTRNNKQVFGLKISGFIILYFLIMLGFQNNVQIGIRHVLMIYPLIYVMAGWLTIFPFFKRNRKILYPVIVLYAVAGFYFYFPNLLAYSNEFIPEKKSAYRVMADSNIDFGQGKFAAEKYLQKNKDVKWAVPEPTPGKLILSINDYLDLDNSHRYSWLGKYKPVRHVNHCYLLVEVPAGSINQ